MGSVLYKNLNALGMMLNKYKHTAQLCPSPSERESLPIIHLSNIIQDTEESLIAKYVYNIQFSESGYIKPFKIHITSSYAELGRPPREQTIEGQEAMNYMHSLQKNHFGIQKVEKTIHGNPPCIMLAHSIRGEDDHRIKAEIIDRLEKTKQQLAIEQLDVVWVTVSLPNTNTKAAAKCITIPRESHTLLPQVIHAINTLQNKTDYPHAYNYNATALIPPTAAIDHAIKTQAKFTRSLTSVSITGLNEIDIYSTKLKETTTIVQQIINGT